MAVPLDNPQARLPGTGDMFLYVKGAKHGVIVGEATDKAHKDEIEVLSWTWGMEQRIAAASGLASGKAIVRELKISKKFDKASTALMSALRTNELIKEATLTLRKTGKTPLEYLKVKIKDGRVTSLEVQAGDVTGNPAMIEHVAFSFNKITVEYTPQGQDGQPLGSTSFEDEWNVGA